MKETGMTALRNIKNIPRYILGRGALATVPGLLADRRRAGREHAPLFLIDQCFDGALTTDALAPLGIQPGDAVRFVSTVEEPSTQAVDDIMHELRALGYIAPCAVVGMGGGITLDTAKAVANLFTNPGNAADYQGWDLVRSPGIYKIGIPTISGTGAESSRTCVMTNHDSGLKLGMNSDHTLYDQLVLDPDLSATVDRNQYFYTGMDAYIHCVESLAGRFRNPVGDALSEQVLSLCRGVFLGGEDMMSAPNRERLMTASYLGGCALATSFVGVVHPMSAGLSVVLGTHHCVANCITMLAMDEYYPDACREFRSMIEAQRVEIPRGLCAAASDDQLRRMCAAAGCHEKPLANALGPDFRNILTPERMTRLFRCM
jgi:3-deoxy-alpha-D-manno-octulosonate 8-oxidase